MPLRGRVGQHGVGGRQCQNWIDDQNQVTYLLNLIPAAQGGAEGKLDGQPVLGIASQALNLAILRFEDKNFPGQRSGFVDPDGKMWQLMLKLAKPVYHRGIGITKSIDNASPLFFMDCATGIGF
jgi:hypothetical protein